METIIQLIFVISLLRYVVKSALSNHLWTMVGYGLVLALVAIGLYPIVINQPMSIIADLLASRRVIEDMALLTTAESIIGIMISILLLDNYFQPRAKRTRRARMIKLCPGIVEFFAVAYFQLLFFKWRVGGDFLVTAMLYAALVFGLVLGLSLLVRWLVDGESLKLEVKLLLNLAVLVLGLLVSSSVADYNLSHAQTTVEWGALAAVSFGAFLLVALGYLFHRIHLTYILSNLFKWNK